MEFIYQLYRWSEHKIKIIVFGGSITFFLGFYTYSHIYKLGYVESTIYALELFAMDVKHPAEVKELIWHENNNSESLVFKTGEINSSYYEKECCEHWFTSFIYHWKLIYLAGFFATITLMLGVFLLFFREQLSFHYQRKIIKKGEHTIVVGLGRNSRFFIDDALKDKDNRHKMIVFERDRESLYFEKYKKQAMALDSRSIDILFDKLNIKNCKNILISTGDDEQNIYYALEFLKRLPSKNEEGNKAEKFNKLVLHINNRTLRNLYADKNILSSKNIDIRIFSFYKEASRLLFMEHPIEGDGAIEDLEEKFSINVVGNSELAISVVAEACRLAHYPEKNRLTINCIDRDIQCLKKNISYAFPEIEVLKELNIFIRYFTLDSESIGFYKHSIWQHENIKHIILCDDNVEENIRIATKLKAITYLRKERTAKLHIATMNHIKIANKMDELNKDKKIFSFARADNICSAENLFDNEMENLAKMIHCSYDSPNIRENGILKHDHDSIFSVMCSDLKTRNWNNASINDKRSSVGQAIHIQSKLKILGLSSQTAVLKEDVYEKNKAIFYTQIKSSLEELGLNKKIFVDMEKDYSNKKTISKVKYFPQEYTNIWEKLLKVEHNRWMAILFLMDNSYDEYADDETRKELKVHSLLKSLNEFNTPYEQSHIINDINAILNIPLYLSQIGKEIVYFNNIN